MYLKNIAIKNYGPINEINIQLPFNESGNPKPIIFVGKNGTGKTILLSQIMDSFYEIMGDIFKDVKKYEGFGTKFFKLSGTSNLQIGKKEGFTLLQYELDGSKIRYFDKVGKVSIKDFKMFISDFDLSPNNNDSFEKNTKINVNKNKLEQELLNGAYFYHPAYRYEEPFWKNDDFKHNIQIKEYKRFSGQFGKELEIVNSIEENKHFLLNLVLDYVARINEFDEILWKSVNIILNAVKKTEDLMFWIGSRANFRLSIVRQDNNNLILILPSINNLSLGELILLDMFINIIRHACIYKSKPLEEIEGIVIIDEVDVHLHSDLQFEVLPQLIKLFPKVQFILTTHSPLFLLGMKKYFGEDGFEIRNMPNGEIISVERFSEFENAFNYLKETEKFNQEFEKKIMELSKPVIFVEGPTDIKYIKKFFELYDKTDELAQFKIDIIGEITPKGTKNSNNKALKNAANFLKSNLSLIQNKILLLNDPEENIKEEIIHNKLFIKKIPKLNNTPLQKGIENLFEEDFIKKVRENNKDCFEYHVIGEKETNLKILGDKKEKICNWICENATQDDFKNFEQVYEIIINFIKE
jgi:predicted ATP-dependent endonuclease of OLD family